MVGETFEKIGDIKGVSDSLLQRGNIYYLKRNYNEAMNQYKKSLEIFENLLNIEGISLSLHGIGMIYQKKGDYDAALKQYLKAFEMSEKIGNIPSAAISMGQMGNLHFQKKEFETALKYLIQAFLLFTKIGSPNANKARELISRTRKKMSKKKFDAVLKEFNLKPETFAEDPQKHLLDFLAGVTSQAFSVKEKSSQEKEKIAAQVNEIINKLPDDKPEIQGFKSYIQMLIAYASGEDVQTYMEKIPKELKEMFKKIQEEKKGSKSVGERT